MSNETISRLMCLFVGFHIGVMTLLFDNHFEGLCPQLYRLNGSAWPPALLILFGIGLAYYWVTTKFSRG